MSALCFVAWNVGCSVLPACCSWFTSVPSPGFLLAPAAPFPTDRFSSFFFFLICFPSLFFKCSSLFPFFFFLRMDACRGSVDRRAGGRRHIWPRAPPCDCRAAAPPSTLLGARPPSRSHARARVCFKSRRWHGMARHLFARSLSSRRFRCVRLEKRAHL